jgi:hypothetical protein
MSKWVALTEFQPPDGLLVETKIDDDKGIRNQCNLVRKGSLFFVNENLSMYIYDSPTHWRYLPEENQQKKS